MPGRAGNSQESHDVVRRQDTFPLHKRVVGARPAGVHAGLVPEATIAAVCEREPGALRSSTDPEGRCSGRRRVTGHPLCRGGARITVSEIHFVWMLTIGLTY